jgi:transcription termination/antitermination protein NusG
VASLAFDIGEPVRVVDGPFVAFNGAVEEVDDTRSSVKIAVSFYGRQALVELAFGQVEKL